MAKKYNKITKEQVLELFKTYKVINRATITERYNCSIYSVRREIENLVDDGVIRLTSYGYKLKNK